MAGTVALCVCAVAFGKRRPVPGPTDAELARLADTLDAMARREREAQRQRERATAFCDGIDVGFHMAATRLREPSRN